MEDGIHAFGGLADGFRVAQVAGDDLQRGQPPGGQILQQAVAVLRVVADKAADFRAGVEQPLHQVAADKPARAGDQDAPGCQFHVLLRLRTVAV